MYINLDYFYFSVFVLGVIATEILYSPGRIMVKDEGQITKFLENSSLKSTL